MRRMVSAFKIGEKVVYPAHGVGVIEGVQTKVISGSERKFYMLRIIDSDMTIMIPTENVQSVGLRRIIGKEMVAKVYKILRDKKVEIDQQTWNRRYREYTEKIKTGSVLEPPCSIVSSWVSWPSALAVRVNDESCSSGFIRCRATALA